MVRLGRTEASPLEVAYLFSSGYRRLYREDVFNTLAYPPNFVIQFRYREPWVDDRIQDADSLEGMEAVIVSCPRVYRPGYRHMGGVEENHCGFNFYPLRRGEIIEATERGGAIHVYCKLGPELVEYPEENGWDANRPLSHASELTDLNFRQFRAHPGSYILELVRRPHMGEKDDPDDVFISLGPELELPFYEFKGSKEKAWVGQEDEWIALVKFLEKDEFFEGNLFYRLRQIQPVSNTLGYRVFHPIRSLFWSRSRAEPIFMDTAVGYTIDSGGQYRMDVSLAFADEPPEQTKTDDLVFDSSDLIEIFPSNFNLGFRTDERSLIVDPTSIGKHHYSAVETEVENQEENYFAPRLDIKFDLYPTLLRRIGVFVLLIIGVAIVVASGPVSGLASTLLTENVPGFSPSVNGVNLFLVLLGLTLTTLAFRIRGSRD